MLLLDLDLNMLRLLLHGPHLHIDHFSLSKALVLLVMLLDLQVLNSVVLRLELQLHVLGLLTRRSHFRKYVRVLIMIRPLHLPEGRSGQNGTDQCQNYSCLHLEWVTNECEPDMVIGQLKYPKRTSFLHVIRCQ